MKNDVWLNIRVPNELRSKFSSFCAENEVGVSTKVRSLMEGCLSGSPGETKFDDQGVKSVDASSTPSVRKEDVTMASPLVGDGYD